MSIQVPKNERSTFCDSIKDADFASAELRVVGQLSPLARAALACGIDFDDVYEYELALQRAYGRPRDLPEELMRLASDEALENALEASQAHMADTRPCATLPASKLWWQGVL